MPSPAILYFAKGLNRVALEREAGAFDHRAYRPVLLEGKTACVVGAGGIGARSRPAVRRARDAGRRHAPQPGAARCRPALARSAAPATSTGFCRTAISSSICCQWTPETTQAVQRSTASPR